MVGALLTATYYEESEFETNNPWDSNLNLIIVSDNDYYVYITTG